MPPSKNNRAARKRAPHRAAPRRAAWCRDHTAPKGFKRDCHLGCIRDHTAEEEPTYERETQAQWQARQAEHQQAQRVAQAQQQAQKESEWNGFWEQPGQSQKQNQPIPPQQLA